MDAAAQPSDNRVEFGVHAKMSISVFVRLSNFRSNAGGGRCCFNRTFGTTAKICVEEIG